MNDLENEIFDYIFNKFIEGGNEIDQSVEEAIEIFKKTTSGKFFPIHNCVFSKTDSPFEHDWSAVSNSLRRLHMELYLIIGTTNGLDCAGDFTVLGLTIKGLKEKGYQI